MTRRRLLAFALLTTGILLVVAAGASLNGLMLLGVILGAVGIVVAD